MVDIEVFGVYHHLAWRQRHESGVDVHRLPTSALELMDAQTAAAKVTAQPTDPAAVRDIAANYEQVATTARNVSGVKYRLEFVDNVADGFIGFRYAVAFIEQFVGQLWPRCRRPARTAVEIFFEQFPIGVALELARTSARWRFDNLVADHQKNVAWAGKAKALR